MAELFLANAVASSVHHFAHFVGQVIGTERFFDESSSGA
jgi:hypothetical protein